MLRAMTGRAACWTALVLLSVGGAAVGQRAFGDEPPAKEARRVHNRLPPHYAGVVDEEQREAIYKLQDEYKPKIQAMQAELNALRKEMNEKVSAVLTADQKKKVNDAAGKIKAKKAKPVPEVLEAEPEKSK